MVRTTPRRSRALASRVRRQTVRILISCRLSLRRDYRDRVKSILLLLCCARLKSKQTNVHTCNNVVYNILYYTWSVSGSLRYTRVHIYTTIQYYRRFEEFRQPKRFICPGIMPIVQARVVGLGQVKYSAQIEKFR